ncbi:MAG TPA: PDZ domain-containing protein [Polyangia bacterium]|nr:PDZ domain-containing protein [Polyangia bacterium]
MPAARRPAPVPVVYKVAMPQPASHEYEVDMQVPALAGRTEVEIVFPTWAPGSYMVRDFVRHLIDLAITDGAGRALDPARVARLDKQRWRIQTGGRPFRVRYRVFAFEATVRTSFLDDSHAYWNGTSLFFFVDGELARPCHVRAALPDRRWRVSTALPPVAGQRLTWAAADFDELADAPFEIGTHALHAFNVGKTRFELALYGRTNADPARLVDILRRVVSATGRIFGGFPFDRYLFIVHALPVGSGGLEHRASVTMDITGLSFEDENGYVRFADLAAHEFFHAWNVKRIHDAALGTSRRGDPQGVPAAPRDGLRSAEPSSVHALDYTRENYTTLLWLFEGCTDYLAHVIILRAGVTSPAQFFKMIAEDWPKYATRPGRNQSTLEELSFEAWVKQYKPSENFTNRAASYYEKGFWTAMALDLELRLANGGRQGLPEMFHRLWTEFGRDGRPIADADVRAAAASLAGRPLDRFFDRYVRGKEDLHLPAFLARAGVEVHARADWDESGRAPQERDPVRSRRARAWTGLALQPDRTIVRNVIPDSPAWAAGLTFNDEIVAVDGARVSGATFGKRIADHRPGARIKLAYFRRDELREAWLTLAESPERRLTVVPNVHAGARVKAIRSGWLGVKV